MLTDTGPIVALLNERDQKNSDAVRQIKLLPSRPLLTTWPCFTEAMYLLGRVGGYRYQRNLWLLQASKKLRVHNFSASEIERMKDLMQQYRDTPMDIADASLVAVSESLNIREIFTFDHHFYIYRLIDGDVLEVCP